MLDNTIESSQGSQADQTCKLLMRFFVNSCYQVQFLQGLSNKDASRKMNSRDRTIEITGALLWIAFAFQPVVAKDAPVQWKVGTAFQRELKLISGVSWPKNPLRATVLDYAKTRRIAVFMDRRVDPGQNFRFVSQRGPLDVLLRRLARQLNLDIGFVGSVIYFGPGRTSTKLATMAKIRSDQARKLGDESSRMLLRSRRWSWPSLTTPKELLNQLASEVNLVINNQQLVPHDLWPETSLPAMSWIERLTLVLAGFNLTFEFDSGGKAISIVPIPASVGIEKMYRVSSQSKVDALKSSIPGSYEFKRNQLWVKATVENHRSISRFLAGGGRKKTVSKGPRRKYQKLKVKNKSISQIIRLLAQDQQLELVTDPAIRAKLGKLVKLFEVKDATLQEVLDKLFAGQGLSYVVRPGKLIIRAKGAAGGKKRPNPQAKK